MAESLFNYCMDSVASENPSYPVLIMIVIDAFCNRCFLIKFQIKVNPAYVSQIEEKGMKFVGRDVEGERMEIMEIKGMAIKINDNSSFHFGVGLGSHYKSYGDARENVL